MTNKNSSKMEVPQAKEAMNRFKMEVANEIGVNLKDGYNGDLTSREAGSIGEKVQDMKEAIKKLSWAVAYKIDKKTQDDGITKVVTVAKFNTAEAGANFIKKCLPEETKERFFVVDADALEACEDADKIKCLEHSEAARFFAYVEKEGGY